MKVKFFPNGQTQIGDGGARIVVEPRLVIAGDGGPSDGYTHVQVTDLPATLSPNTVYFVANGGKVVVTDAAGNPTEYVGGGKDYWQFGFYGDFRLARGTVPSGNDRYTRILNSDNKIVKWNWGSELNDYAFLFAVSGWHVPAGYKFTTLRVNGGWQCDIIKYWSIYLFKGKAWHLGWRGHTQNLPISDPWLVQVFPIEMPSNEGRCHVYGLSLKYDISDLGITTEEDEIYYMLIIPDDPSGSGTMTIRSAAIIFELEK